MLELASSLIEMEKTMAFLLLFSILQITLCSCPEGFDLVRDGECRGNSYVTDKLNGSEAVYTAISMCKDSQAHPVIVHTEETWLAGSTAKFGLECLQFAKPIYDTCLICSATNVLDKSSAPGPSTFSSSIEGIVCNSNSKRWEWVDGSPLDYNPEFRNSNYSASIAECDPECTWSILGYSWIEHCGGYVADYDIYCTAQLHSVVLSDDNCQSIDGDTADDVCYEVGETAENWQDAQASCRQLGANLVSIHNLQENSFIRRLAVSTGATSGIFIGATISGKGNAFSWIDGSVWNYDHFLPGFPIDGLGDCLVMNTDDTSGQWVNVDCSSKLPVACKRQVAYTSPVCSSGPWKEGELIYSPGYPIEASIPCEFLLTVAVGQKVEVNIQSLEANSCCDYLILYENYFGGTVIANLTGEVNDKTYATSSSNFMRVSWMPNGGVNVRGMMMTFRGV